VVAAAIQQDERSSRTNTVEQDEFGEFVLLR
jgi:hypothetical protein